MNQRFRYIDALRGIAILGVIVAHAGSISGLQGSAGQFALLGAYGIQLFFVVSGFTIFLSLDRYRNSKSSPVYSFFIRRFFRIIPIYWFGIILYTMVYGLGSRGWLPGPELWHFPVHILLMNLLLPETQSSVVPGGWSISCEILFYLLVPLLFSLIKSSRSALIFLVLAIFIGPWLTQLLSSRFTFEHLNISRDMLDLYWYRSIPNQIGCFAAGIVLFHLQRDYPSLLHRLKNHRVNLAFCFLVLLLLVSAYNHAAWLKPHFIYSMGFACFALVLSQIPWRLAVNKLTVFMGKISYSAYLIHFLVLKQTTLAMSGISLEPVSNFLVILLAGIVITIPLAYLSYRCIELPFMDYGKKLVMQFGNRRETGGFART